MPFFYNFNLISDFQVSLCDSATSDSLCLGQVPFIPINYFKNSNNRAEDTEQGPSPAHYETLKMNKYVSIYVCIFATIAHTNKQNKMTD